MLTKPPSAASVPAHAVNPPAAGRPSRVAWSRSLGVAFVAVMMTLVARPCQARPSVAITGHTPGPTPFISLLSLRVDDLSGLDYVTFTILPKPGSVTRAISARYSAAYLSRRGYVDAQTSAITVPVFGLYANYENTVTVTTAFLSGYSQVNQLTVATTHLGNDLHKRPTIAQARTTDTSLSYDFIMLKTAINANSPLILDTDGEIRWVGTSGSESFSCAFYNNGVYISEGTSVLRMELDGSVSMIGDYASTGAIDFHHNFDFGRDGIITDVDTNASFESTNVEIDPVTGQVLHVWDLAAIISAAMTAGGDDPTQFVKPFPTDWFHNNATAYRASDNTLLVSSREDFVIALDYDTGAIKWILGDSSKSWYSFASLRKYALTLGPNTVAPIGQHAVSIVRDQLLLFDDGYPSLSQAYPGKGRPYSAPRKYHIDTVANTATEIWNYKAHRSIDSPVCSSVYEDQKDNFLIDYATAGPFVYLELVGLNVAGDKVFDYQYKEVDTCYSGWNAVPIHLESLVFN